jgi:hypothetical protein
VKRGTEIAVLVVAVAIVVAFGWSARGTDSTYSTFDTGPNGYEALYNVLAAEGVAVSRLTQPLGLMASGTRVFAVTKPFAYDRVDAKRLETFVKNGGVVVAFGEKGDKRDDGLPPRTVRLNVLAYRNVALERDPGAAATAYAALAGHGPVVFDEHVHGYDTERSMWSVFPAPVRIACWMLLAALLLALIGTNVRFAPALPVLPPGDRDSSDYIASMAQLLRRARAPHVAYERKDHV